MPGFDDTDLLGVTPLLEAVIRDIAMVKQAIKDIDIVKIECLLAKIPFLNLLKLRKKVRNIWRKGKYLNVCHSHQVPFATRASTKSKVDSLNESSVVGDCRMWSPLDEHEDLLQYGSNNEFVQPKLKRTHSDTAGSVKLGSTISHVTEFLSSWMALETDTCRTSRSTVSEQRVEKDIQELKNLMNSSVRSSKRRKKKLLKAIGKSVEASMLKKSVPGVKVESSVRFDGRLKNDINSYTELNAELQQIIDRTNVLHKICFITSISSREKAHLYQALVTGAALGGIPVTEDDLIKKKTKIVHHKNNETLVPYSYRNKHMSQNARMKPKKSPSRRRIHFVERSRRKCPKSATDHFAGITIPRVRNNNKIKRWQKRVSHRFRSLHVKKKKKKRRKHRLPKQSSGNNYCFTSEHSPTKCVRSGHIVKRNLSQVNDDELIHSQRRKRELIGPKVITHNKDSRKICPDLGIRPCNGSSVEKTKHLIFSNTSEGEWKGVTKDRTDQEMTTVSSKDNKKIGGIKTNLYFFKGQPVHSGQCTHNEKTRVGRPACQNLNNNALPHLQKLSNKRITKDVLYNERCDSHPDKNPKSNCASISLRETKSFRLPVLSIKTRTSLFSNEGDRVTSTGTSKHVSSISINTDQINDKSGKIKSDNKKHLDKLKSNGALVSSDATNEMQRRNRSLRMSSLPLTVKHSRPTNVHGSKTKHETRKNNLFTKPYPTSESKNNIQEFSDSIELMFPSISHPSLSIPHIVMRNQCQADRCIVEWQDYSPENQFLEDEGFVKKARSIDKSCLLDTSLKTYAGSRLYELVTGQSISLKSPDLQQSMEEIHVGLGDNSRKVSSSRIAHSCKTSNSCNTNNNANETSDDSETSHNESSAEVCDISQSMSDFFISSKCVTRGGFLQNICNDDPCRRHKNKNPGHLNNCSDREKVPRADLESCASSTEVGEELELELLSLIVESSKARLNKDAKSTGQSFNEYSLYNECVGTNVNRSVNNPNKRTLHHRRCVHRMAESNCRQRQARYDEHLKRRNIPVPSQDESSHDLDVYSNVCNPPSRLNNVSKSKEEQNIEPVDINTEEPSASREYQIRESGNIPLLQEHSCSLPGRDVEENDIAVNYWNRLNTGYSRDDSKIPFYPTTENYWDSAAHGNVSNPFQYNNHQMATDCDPYDNTTCHPFWQQSNSESSCNVDRSQHAEQQVNDLINSDASTVIPVRNDTCNSHFKDLYKHLNAMWMKSENKINQQLRCLNDTVNMRLTSLQNLVENKLKGECGVSRKEKGHVQNKRADHEHKNIGETKEHIGTIRLSTTQEKVRGHSHGRSLDISEYNRTRTHQEIASDEYCEEDEYVSKESSKIIFDTFPTIRFNEITQKSKENINNYLSENDDEITYTRSGNNFIEHVGILEPPRLKTFQNARRKPLPTGKKTPKCRHFNSQRGRKNVRVYKKLKKTKRGRPFSPRYKSLRLFKEDANNPLGYVFKNDQNALSRYRRHKHSRSCRRRHVMNDGVCCNMCLPTAPLDLNESPEIKMLHGNKVANNREDNKRGVLKHYSRKPKNVNLKPYSRRSERYNLKPYSRTSKRFSLIPHSSRSKHFDTKPYKRISRRSNLKHQNIIPRRSRLKPHNRIPKRSSLKPRDYIPKRSSLKPRDYILKRSSLKRRDHIPKRFSLKPRDHIPKRSSLKSRDRIPKRSSLKPRDRIPKRSSLKPRDRIPKRSSLKRRDHIPKRFSLKPRDHIPKRCSLKSHKLRFQRISSKPHSRRKPISGRVKFKAPVHRQDRTKKVKASKTKMKKNMSPRYARA